MGLIKADIIAAKQAIAYFEENKIRDIKNIAAYHIQQAMEKLIKIQVYCKSNDYDNHKMFNHSTALLAGDALANQAYIVLSNDLKNSSTEDLNLKLRAFDEFTNSSNPYPDCSVNLVGLKKA